jgi:hypothetical protein
MLAIGMLAAAAGLVLGLRFSVMVLVLVSLAIIAIFATSVSGGSRLLVVGLQILVTLSSVQIGYLFGCLLAVHLPLRAMTRSDRIKMRYLRGLPARTVTR